MIDDGLAYVVSYLDICNIEKQGHPLSFLVKAFRVLQCFF